MKRFKNEKLSIEDVEEIGKLKGIKLIEKPCKFNYYTKLKWLCKCGKIWETIYNNVQRSKGCRSCWNDRNKGDKHYNWNPDRDHILAYKKLFKVCRGQITRCNSVKNAKTLDMLGYSLKQFKEHIESTWEPWMNWSNYGKYNKDKRTWQIDHIKPIVQFYNERISDVKVINALNNLRALDSKENIGRYNLNRRLKKVEE